MPTFTITSIRPSSDFRVKGPGVDSFPGSLVVNEHGPLDLPIAFHLPVPLPKDYSIKMEVNCTADLGDLSALEKARWQTLDTKYKLVAQVAGGPPLMQSALATFLGNRIGDKMLLEVREFQFLQDARLPFKCDGNWSWSLVLERPTGSAKDTLSMTASTRLEVYFLLSRPPTSLAVANTGINTWPAQVLRFFIPPLSALPPNLDEQTRLRWWAAHVVDTVWNYSNPALRPQLHYSRTNTNSYYTGAHSHADQGLILESDVDTFLIDKWIRQPDQACNCSDLAYIVSIGCQTLGVDEKEKAILPHAMISVDKFGYVAPGPLFGWTATQQQLECNNPFSTPEDINFTIDNQDNQRNRFTWHCWIEADFPANGAKDTRVLEACHGLRDRESAQGYTLARGTQTRLDFVAQARNTGPRGQDDLNHASFRRRETIIRVQGSALPPPGSLE